MNHHHHNLPVMAAQPRQLLRRGWRFLNIISKRGHRFICPICGGQWRVMLPAGAARRPNACCPRCYSVERHRLIWIYIERQTDLLSRPRRMLMVAPDEALQNRLSHYQNIDFLSVDLESPLAMKHMDVTKLDLPDNSFDVIFCNHVLEHIPDDRQAMRELFRVLKPGGWAILQTPIDYHRATTDEDPSITDPQERIRRFGQVDHVRTYGRDFFERLQSVGWRVEKNNFSQSLAPTEIEKFRVDPTELLIIGHK